jgi:hypothetical protein
MVERKQLNLKLEEDYKDQLEKIAEKNQRSVVGQIRYWIDQVKEE